MKQTAKHRSTVSVALIVGIPTFCAGYVVRGCVQSSLDKNAEESAKRQQDERKEAAIAKAVETCRYFPEEKICKEEHSEYWATRVEQCFTETQAEGLGLSDDCNSFGDEGLEELILPHFIVRKDGIVEPITPPAILLKQTKQGEQIAESITPQAVVIAGEVVLKENFARLVNEIAASHSATGQIPGPCGEGCKVFDPSDPIENLIEKHRLSDGTLQPVPAEESEAIFAHILDGQSYPEIKTEFEQMFDLKLGLSRQLESLSETDKRTIGLVIGLYNHAVRNFENTRQRIRVKAINECSKYPPDTLRPTRCAALKR